jgi:hypothetical protein
VQYSEAVQNSEQQQSSGDHRDLFGKALQVQEWKLR